MLETYLCCVYVHVDLEFYLTIRKDNVGTICLGIFNID